MEKRAVSKSDLMKMGYPEASIEKALNTEWFCEQNVQRTSDKKNAKRIIRLSAFEDFYWKGEFQ